MEYETGISSDCSELRLARGDKTRSKEYKIGSRGGRQTIGSAAWYYLLRANWFKDRISLLLRISMDWGYLLRPQ